MPADDAPAATSDDEPGSDGSWEQVPPTTPPRAADDGPQEQTEPAAPEVSVTPWRKQMRWGPGQPRLTHVAVEPHGPTSPSLPLGSATAPAPLTVEDDDFDSFVVNYHTPSRAQTIGPAGGTAEMLLSDVESPLGPAARGPHVLEEAPVDLMFLVDDGSGTKPKYPWSSLGPAMREAAVALGYEGETWPHHVKDHIGWEEWDELAPEKQDAWRILGVDADSYATAWEDNSENEHVHEQETENADGDRRSCESMGSPDHEAVASAAVPAEPLASGTKRKGVGNLTAMVACLHIMWHYLDKFTFKLQQLLNQLPNPVGRWMHFGAKPVGVRFHDVEWTVLHCFNVAVSCLGIEQLLHWLLFSRRSRWLRIFLAVSGLTAYFYGYTPAEWLRQLAISRTRPVGLQETATADARELSEPPQSIQDMQWQSTNQPSTLANSATATLPKSSGTNHKAIAEFAQASAAQQKTPKQRWSQLAAVHKASVAFRGEKNVYDSTPLSHTVRPQFHDHCFGRAAHRTARVPLDFTAARLANKMSSTNTTAVPSSSAGAPVEPPNAATIVCSEGGSRSKRSPRKLLPAKNSAVSTDRPPSHSAMATYPTDDVTVHAPVQANPKSWTIAHSADSKMARAQLPKSLTPAGESSALATADMASRMATKQSSFAKDDSTAPVASPVMSVAQPVPTDVSPTDASGSMRPVEVSVAGAANFNTHHYRHSRKKAKEGSRHLGSHSTIAPSGQQRWNRLATVHKASMAFKR